MATPAALRREVLGLYRACLRSARKCPEWEKREMMKTYVRMKFRDEVHTQDTTRIRRLLADAREELDQMEYYHSVYEEKQRLRVSRVEGGAAGNAPRSVDTTLKTTAQDLGPASAFANTSCPRCGSHFTPPDARFCSSCGQKRL